MSTINPCQPDTGAGKYIDVSAASQNVQLGTDSFASSWMVINEGTATAYIKTGGTNAVVATMPAAGASNCALPAGSVQVLTLEAPASTTALWVAVIAAGATGKVHFVPILNRSRNGI